MPSAALGGEELVLVDVERTGDVDPLVVAGGELVIADDYDVHTGGDRGSQLYGVPGLGGNRSGSCGRRWAATEGESQTP